MRLKDPVSSFVYCPICASRMELLDHDHRMRKVCPSCGFVDFHNPAPAAGGVIVEEGKLLLVQRANDPYMGDWCIPAGFMEWDESPQECARRELLEETGLIVEPTRIFNVYSGKDDPRTNAVLILYFCEIKRGSPTPGDDAAAVEFFSLNKIPKNIAFLAHRQAIRDLTEQYPGLLR